MNVLANFISTLESRRLYNCASKELFGANIPHTFLPGMVSSSAERLEQGIGQFGSSFFQTPVALLAEQVMDKTVGRLPLPGPDGTALSNDIWLMGKTFSLYSLTAGGLLSVPFIRNVVSMSRTGRTDFVGVTGLNGAKSTEDPEKVKLAIAQNVKTLEKTLLTTVSVSAGLAIGSALTARYHTTLPKPLMAFLAKHEVLLPKGEYRNLTDMGATLGWGIPAYTGCWFGSRDKVEKQEIGLRAGAWVFAFSVFPKMLEKALLRGVKAEDPVRFVGNGKNLAFVAQLALSVGLYTLIPTFVTLVTRKSRARQAGLLVPHAPETPIPPLPVATVKPEPLSQPFRPLSVVSVASDPISVPLLPSPINLGATVLPLKPSPILIPLSTGGFRIPALSH
jgi:hypothetical protein